MCLLGFRSFSSAQLKIILGERHSCLYQECRRCSLTHKTLGKVTTRYILCLAISSPSASLISFRHEDFPDFHLEATNSVHNESWNLNSVFRVVVWPQYICSIYLLSFFDLQYLSHQVMENCMYLSVMMAVRLLKRQLLQHIGWETSE